MRHQGKVVAVTGGGNGIGRALCEAFAAEGAAHVAVLDLDGDAAAAVAETLGGSAWTIDVADEDQLVSALEGIERRAGPVDVFCANAGLAIAGGVDAPDDDWALAWRVNLMGPVLAARHVVPSMLQRGGGTFVVTASAAGLVTSLFAAPYAVTKHGAVALAEWLAITHGDAGLQVACVCPLGVQTDMLDNCGPLEAMIRPGSIQASEVADALMDSLDRGEFLVLPHPEVQRFVMARAQHRDAWIAKMRHTQAKLTR